MEELAKIHGVPLEVRERLHLLTQVVSKGITLVVYTEHDKSWPTLTWLLLVCACCAVNRWRQNGENLHGCRGGRLDGWG